VNDAILDGRNIALSISMSPDLAVLGLGKEHLEDAMTEIARHLIACGAVLSYGGDLREGGFTDLLFEIVNRYRANDQSERILASNYLAWPVHASMTAESIAKLEKSLEGLARLVLLDIAGKEMSLADRASGPVSPAASDWIGGLTAMRRKMAADIDARISLGGQTANYKGRYPGIAEEALIQLERKAPLFLLGGFGGCSLDIARAMGIDRRIQPSVGALANWPGLELFAAYRPNDLQNGLDDDENGLLAETVHIDQAVALILHGLMNLSRPKKKPRRKR
jgi:hypothetical protein